MDFNFLDIIIAVLLLGFTGWGALTGFFRQLSTIVALLGAWLVAWGAQAPLQDLLSEWFDAPAIAANVIAFPLAFCLIKVLWNTFTRRLAANAVIGAGNRVGGALLGLLKGAALCVALVAALSYLGKDKLREESFCVQQAGVGYEWLQKTDLYQRVRDEIKRALDSDNTGGLTDGVKKAIRERLNK
ncbi:hypothetical protein AGMMS49959_00180 [Planctomycetales bacterium]|nr:hypothetical protein AGMMS49959_00180 [Planctomycetales bacterium]